MKRARLMILLLVVILVSPALLFAADWVTQGLQDFRADPVEAFKGGVGAVSGALSSGYNTYIAPTSIGTNLQAISTGLQNINPQTLGAGAVKFATMRYSTFKEGVSFGSDFVSKGSDLVSKYTTAATSVIPNMSAIQTTSFTDWKQNNSFRLEGIKAYDKVIGK
jgi:hypothetical protein